MQIRECNQKVQDTSGRLAREEALERYIFEFIEMEDIERGAGRPKSPVLRKRIQLRKHLMLRARRNDCVYRVGGFCALVIYQDVSKEEKAREQQYQSEDGDD